MTEAQEDALYREGVIPPPEEAEAVLAKSEAAAESRSILTISAELQTAGHKFGLPKKPYPDGFNVKKRYHPVLEQITRLLMRHGELSVAQRVCWIPSLSYPYGVTHFGARILTGTLLFRIWPWS